MKNFLRDAMVFLNKSPDGVSNFRHGEEIAHYLMGMGHSLPLGLNGKNISNEIHGLLYKLLGTHRYDTGLAGLVAGRKEDSQKTFEKFGALHSHLYPEAERIKNISYGIALKEWETAVPTEGFDRSTIANSILSNYGDSLRLDLSGASSVPPLPDGLRS